MPNQASPAVRHRVGMIVPSSNTTAETEVPAILRSVSKDLFSFHSSRAVMNTVDPSQLDSMFAQTGRCAAELADADVDAVAFACLVALMARGPGAHEAVEAELEVAFQERLGRDVAVISSAGALVRSLQELGASRVAILTPYVPELTSTVEQYLGHYGIEVVDSVSLGVADNLAVGRLDPASIPAHIESMDLGKAEAIVASACVQMPSLSAVAETERQFGIPTVTAATATAQELLRAFGITEREEAL